MKAMLAGLAAVVLITAAGCAVTQKSLQEKGLKPMSAKDLQERYARPVKIRWTNDRNQSGTGEYTPDGTARLAWQGGGATGKWRIKEGKFCTTYPEVRGGAETCFIPYRTGPRESVSFGEDGAYAAMSTDID
jgi:hypothetical protein